MIILRLETPIAPSRSRNALPFNGETGDIRRSSSKLYKYRLQRLRWVIGALSAIINFPFVIIWQDRLST